MFLDLHRQIPIRRNNQVIEQLHIDQPESFSNLEGGGFVVDAGLQYPRWVVVSQDGIRGHAMKGKAHQEANIDNTSFHAADIEHAPANDLLAVIQEDYNELFL